MPEVVANGRCSEDRQSHPNMNRATASRWEAVTCGGPSKGRSWPIAVGCYQAG